MKKFEQDYIKHIDSSAPDMDKLWEKIAGAPDEEKDITPFVSASRQCAHKSGKTVRIFVSAAAVLAAVFCAGRLIISDSEISNETSQADMAPEISGEYAADEAEIPSVAAEMGWDYSTETQSADNYYTLDLAETDSGIYNALSHSEAEQEYFVEAQVLEAIEIDYIDESEVLSPADDVYHIDKTQFKVPFVCGARDLGEALRRIAEGAAMIRTKGEPGTGDVVQAVRHMRMMNSEIGKVVSMREDELFEEAKNLRVPYELVEYVHKSGRLPVVNFAAGGVATPADAALMMQLGAEGVFVGSGIFKSGDPKKRAAAIVKAVTNYQDSKMLAELSEDLGEAMVGINEQEIQLLMAERGK